MKSINPATMQIIEKYTDHSQEQVGKIIEQVHESFLGWRKQSWSEKSRLMKSLSTLLRKDTDRLAKIISMEMGKPLNESRGEVTKCAWVCDYYAEHAEEFLKDELFESDGSRAFATFEPLGVILAVMPWNFPFWQVFRFAAPGLMAGNACLLKHASNVSGCALIMEQLFLDAGFPENLFRAILVPGSQVLPVLKHPHVKAVTLTGSEFAGSQIASAAGHEIKKSVLELGGSDAYIVFADADLDRCAETALVARMMNTGQSCIAAKRFLVAEEVHDAFIQKMLKLIEKIVVGDPLDETTTMGPLARPDLRDELHSQVERSLAMGALLHIGGAPVPDTACFYQPTLLSRVRPEMPVFSEETFGPVLPVVPFSTEQEVIELANRSDFGLGGSIWTADVERGVRVARQIESGALFVNGMTKSDPRLPFGGIGKSGFGRELSYYGIKEFVNIKTIWVG
jgi:succinate-semialdehyde dehydrogenase/glutarate-semialdehyde dehydrogenase